MRAWLAHARTMVGIVDSAVAGILLQQGTGASLGAAWGVTARIVALHLGDLFQVLWHAQGCSRIRLLVMGAHAHTPEHSLAGLTASWQQLPWCHLLTAKCGMEVAGSAWQACDSGKLCWVQDLMAQQVKDEGELQAAGPGRPHRRVCLHSRLPYGQHWKQKPSL